MKNYVVSVLIGRDTCQKCGRQEKLIAQDKKGDTFEFGMLDEFEKDYNNPSGG
jgi:hypothetical protein